MKTQFALLRGTAIAGAITFGLATAALAEDAKKPAKPTGEGRGRPSPEALIAKLDTDSDSMLTFEEWQKAKPNEGKDAEMLRKRFAKMDANKDSKIDKAELTEAFKKMAERGGKPKGEKPGKKPAGE